MIFVADIQRAVADHYGLPIEAMREPDGASGSRQRERARPRQVAMRLATHLTEHSLVRIGQFFGNRDHSTVISACKNVDRLRRDDEKLDRFMCRVSLELVR
jgi:chromosomal replication initiator protein